MSARPAVTSADVGLIVLGAASLAAVVVLTWAVASDIGELMTRNTVRLALAWYGAALATMLWLNPTDWAARTLRGWLARGCWTSALVCLLCHLAVALHYFDHWSHAHALERTRRVSGVAEGLYVSYLFAGLWAADAGFWWLASARYAARPAWVGRSLHAFMLFVVFNSTVVYGSGAIRWVGLLLFAALAAAWWASRRCRGPDALSARPACAP